MALDFESDMINLAIPMLNLQGYVEERDFFKSVIHFTLV